MISPPLLTQFHLVYCPNIAFLCLSSLIACLTSWTEISFKILPDTLDFSSILLAFIYAPIFWLAFPTSEWFALQIPSPCTAQLFKILF